MRSVRLAIPVVLVSVVVCFLVLEVYWPPDLGGVDEGPSSGLSEFEKVDDYPLYVLRFEGDYGFSEYLRTGILRFKFGGGSPSCTCFAAFCEEGELVFGRNFDFPENPALLLFTDSPDGYMSVSMVNLGYFGYMSITWILGRYVSSWGGNTGMP